MDGTMLQLRLPKRVGRHVAVLVIAIIGGIAAAQSSNSSDSTIRAAMAGSPPTLDFMCSFAAQARDYGVYIFESLVTFDENYDVAPQLASSWDVSDDHKTFVFHLRSGVHFHNGESMTANDVVASFQRFLDQSPRKADLGTVDSMEAVDDQTFKIVLASPSAAFLPLLAYPGPAVAVMPADVIKDKKCGDLSTDDIVGTGPYKLAEWVPDKYVHLTRFDDYSPSDGPASGYAGSRTANVADLYFVPVPEASARLAGLETGEYDYAQNIPPESFDRVKGNSDLTPEVIKPSYSDVIHLNTQNGVFKNHDLRRAVQLGLDEEEIMQVAAGNPALMRLDCSLYFQEQTWHSDICANRYNEHDVEGAKALIAKAGYSGEPVRILTASDFQWMYLAGVTLESQLRNLGFNTQLQVYDYSTMIDIFRNKRDAWDISYNGFSIRTDPGAFATVFESTSGYQPYSNPKVDELFAQGRAEFDPAARYKIYEQIQDIIYDDIPVIKHGDVFNVDAANNRIQGFKVFYTTPRFWNVTLGQ